LRLLLALAVALPVTGASCNDRPCEHAQDCPVGEICGRGRICAPRECGFVVDGSVIDSCSSLAATSRGPGYRCVEGICQIVSTDYLDAAGRPPLPGSDSGQAPGNDSGGAPAPADTGPPSDSGQPADSGTPQQADVN
tara:strand:+ start:366 stop:776 length:411 start_codon:yes stop_codon:yes gene_type:complete